jgi:DNA replication and repair protein RecF
VHLTQVVLTDFRSYESVQLDLDPGAVALIGPNGQGKTNFIEAVGYLSTFASHRVSQDTPLVRAGVDRAVVRAGIRRGGRDVLIELEIASRGPNRAKLNRAQLPRARDLLGTLRTVLFAPEDLALVKGDPDGRRRFLDDLLVSRAPRFAQVRSDFDKVLRQRNALLKSAGPAIRSGRGDVRTLDVWDAHLATVGAELLTGRLHLVRLLAPHVQTAYTDVAAGAGRARIDYRSNLGEDVVADAGFGRELLQARILEALARKRPQELERGVSLVGPHRDDLVISLGQFPAKGYASHGESWSLALALRLAGYHLLREDPGPDGDGEPVLILDDVFAELDVGRRDRLAEIVRAAEQVLITAAVPQDVPEGLDGARVDVMDGQMRRVR